MCNRFIKSITAYIRLANEEHTILPCLESIKDIFDEILILHSDITDNSLELIHNYKNQKINIKKYPYFVIPPHSDQYKTGNYDSKNSLASYYNYGLQFIKTDLLMKIDADQIYFNNDLKKLITNTRQTSKNIYIGCVGHNCIVSNSQIYQHKSQPYNGGRDHFIIPTKAAAFVQTKYWEKLSLNYHIEYEQQPNPYWFHLKKGHRYNSQFVSGDKYLQASLTKFDEKLSQKYEKYVLPLLVKTGSVFQNLTYKC